MRVSGARHGSAGVYAGRGYSVDVTTECRTIVSRNGWMRRRRNCRTNLRLFRLKRRDGLDRSGKKRPRSHDLRCRCSRLRAEMRVQRALMAVVDEARVHQRRGNHSSTQLLSEPPWPEARPTSRCERLRRRLHRRRQAEVRRLAQSEGRVSHQRDEPHGCDRRSGTCSSSSYWKRGVSCALSTSWT